MTNIGSILDAVPPQDLEAERCLLGGVLLVNESLDVVGGIVATCHFYTDANRRIFKAMSDLYNAGHRGIDVVTLRDELSRRGELDHVGGTQYLLQLLETVPHAAHAEYYAKLVRKCWIRRSIIEAATESIKEAHMGHVECDETLATVTKKFRDIDSGDGSGMVNMPEMVQSMLDVIVDRMANDTPPDMGLPTGWQGLDQIITGIKKDWLVVLASRPAVGKTAIVGSIAAHTVKRGDAVMLFSLEMSGTELGLRMLACESRVSGARISHGKLEEVDQYEINRAGIEMKLWPLSINERAGISITEVCAMIRQGVTRDRTKLVIIDYLQLMKPADVKAPREQQISAMTRMLKVTAKDTHVPIILLCQLNREATKGKDQTPKIHHLRESGAVEQDADVVLLLHRPDTIDPNDRPGQVDVIVAKNRHGPMGTATLTFDKSIMRFRDAGEFQRPEKEF